ncbi:MAG: LapA family protein [Gammaproteobacteria bacterium]|nr:LapA family protein [Gammaproteobacteria bacterium]
MVRLLVALVAVVLGLAFHSRNHDTVHVDLYLVQFDAPLSWVVVAALMGGAVLGALVLLPGLWLKHRALQREQKRLSLLVTPVTTQSPSQTAPGDASGGR